MTMLLVEGGDGNFYRNGLGTIPDTRLRPFRTWNGCLKDPVVMWPSIIAKPGGPSFLSFPLTPVLQWLSI